MAKVFIDMLTNSPLAAAREKHRQGERVDWENVREQQELDAVRATELQAINNMQKEDKADDNFQRQLDAII